mmetsp:Transcript_32131/g.73522  ORF Transcript_32131/g.73522 Transcript_32131/m.73522 type:complete len:394 (-) Transcript_32131:69-1250(-)
MPDEGSRTRVLITGATGLIGRELMRELCPSRWDVLGIARSRQKPNSVKGEFRSCDLTEDGAVEKVVQDFQPQVIVHLAAERRPDAVSRDPVRARRLNVDVVKQLASLCRRMKIWLIFVSTDYVFDGTTPPYSHTAEPNPLNGYGKQKYEAEKVVELCDISGKAETVADAQPDSSPQRWDWAVLRVPLLYGTVEFLAESSVTDLYEKLRQGQLKEADHLQRRYPTHCGDVAKVLRRMIDVHVGGRKLIGYFHFQADECLTKYDMVRVIGEIAGLDIANVVASNKPPAVARPEDSRLDCSRLEDCLGDLSKFRRRFHDGLCEGLRSYIGPEKCNRVLQDISGNREMILSRGQLAALLRMLTPTLHEADVSKILEAAAVDEKEGMAFSAFVQWIFQ